MSVMLSAPHDHARHQRWDLHGRVRPGRTRHGEVLCDQLVQPGLLGQAITGRSPAVDTRLGSSKSAEKL